MKVSYSRELRDLQKETGATLITIDVDSAGGRVTSQMSINEPQKRRLLALHKSLINERGKCSELDSHTAEELKQLGRMKDTEVSHSRADDILIELLKTLGMYRTAEAFANLEKWYA